MPWQHRSGTASAGDVSWTYFYLTDEVEHSFDGAAYDFAALHERVERDMISIQAGRFD